MIRTDPNRSVDTHSDHHASHAHLKSAYWLVSDCERQRLSLSETAMLHEQRMLRVAVCEEGRGVRVALVEIAQQLASLNANIAVLTRRIGGDA